MTQKSLTLSNGSLTLNIVPDQGGRIDDIIDHRTGKNWMWHPEGYQPHSRDLPIGAPFDENWAGGWEEMFPNDAAVEFQGRSLPDHGEVWSQPWHVIESTALGVKLSYSSQKVPVHLEKTIILQESRQKFRINYLVKNLSAFEIPFILKLHPALAIEEGDEFLLPPCWVEPVELGFSTLIRSGEKSRFPKAMGEGEKEIFLNRALPRDTQQREFFYCSDLESRYCGIKNGRTQTTLKMEFDPDHFPYIWVFQSFGGWQEKYVAMLEPCTAIPYDLNQAYERETCPILAPHSFKEFDIQVSIESVSNCPNPEHKMGT